MPRLTMDQREVEVPPGATLLDAAKALGIDVPTLCYFPGLRPSTSCSVCMVKLRQPDRLVPACGTPACDGMVVESETPEVHHARRTALELLLSDHVGDCLAPCHFTCPAHPDIPQTLRYIAAGDLRSAAAVMKETMALSSVLERICPAPCEKGCRRGSIDGAVTIRQLMRFPADYDLASERPHAPACKPDTGKRVAVVGAGPTGLSAAYGLRRMGHAVTILEAGDAPGGRLLRDTSPEELPREVLAAEINAVMATGPELRCGVRLGESLSLDELTSQYDAVLIAAGGASKDSAAAWKLEATPHGLRVERETFQTGRPGVFAAGNAIRIHGLVVRSVADGHEAAVAIDQYLGGRPIHGHAKKQFSVRIGRLEPHEANRFLVNAVAASRREPAEGLTLASAAEQAARCLHCDCRALTTCALRRYAVQYGADPNKFRAARKELLIISQHAKVVYEPGKCIHCGRCIEITSAAKEPLGLTFVGRGFEVRVGVPFDRSMDEALGRVAEECVEACPTAALSFK